MNQISNLLIFSIWNITKNKILRKKWKTHLDNYEYFDFKNLKKCLLKTCVWVYYFIIMSKCLKKIPLNWTEWKNLNIFKNLL